MLLNKEVRISLMISITAIHSSFIIECLEGYRFVFLKRTFGNQYKSLKSYYILNWNSKDEIISSVTQKKYKTDVFEHCFHFPFLDYQHLPSIYS